MRFLGTKCAQFVFGLWWLGCEVARMKISLYMILRTWNFFLVFITIITCICFVFITYKCFVSITVGVCVEGLQEAAGSKVYLGATSSSKGVLRRQMELLWRHHSLLFHGWSDFELARSLWNQRSWPRVPWYQFNCFFHAYPQSIFSAGRVGT